MANILRPDRLDCIEALHLLPNLCPRDSADFCRSLEPKYERRPGGFGPTAPPPFLKPATARGERGPGPRKTARLELRSISMPALPSRLRDILKRSRTLRRAVRWYRAKLLADPGWGRLLPAGSNEHELASNGGSGPPVLLATSLGGYWAGTTIESLLA